MRSHFEPDRRKRQGHYSQARNCARWSACKSGADCNRRSANSLRRLSRRARTGPHDCGPKPWRSPRRLSTMSRWMVSSSARLTKPWSSAPSDRPKRNSIRWCSGAASGPGPASILSKPSAISKRRTTFKSSSICAAVSGALPTGAICSPRLADELGIEHADNCATTKSAQPRRSNQASGPRWSGRRISRHLLFHHEVLLVAQILS